MLRFFNRINYIINQYKLDKHFKVIVNEIEIAKSIGVSRCYFKDTVDEMNKCKEYLSELGYNCYISKHIDKDELLWVILKNYDSEDKLEYENMMSDYSYL